MNIDIMLSHQLTKTNILRTVSMNWPLDFALRGEILSRNGLIVAGHNVFSVEEKRHSDGVHIHAVMESESFIENFSFYCPHVREIIIPEEFNLAHWNVPGTGTQEAMVKVIVLQKYHPGFWKLPKSTRIKLQIVMIIASMVKHSQLDGLSLPKYGNRKHTAGIIGYPIPGEPFSESILKNYLINHGWVDTGSIDFEPYRLFEYEDPESFAEVVVPVTGDFDDLAGVLQFAETLTSEEDTLVKGASLPESFQDLDFLP
jgi:hypothetical protein